jgi:hypothetical protein
MVIVSSFKLDYNCLSGIFTVISRNESICCPLCDGGLVYRDSKLRKLKNLLGEISHFLLRRLHCTECEKLHTELPAIIQPYRHYDSDAIQSVLDDSEDGAACAADNSTIRRWKTEFAEAKPDMNQRLASVYAQMLDEKVSIANTVNILYRIKIKTKHWLAYVMELLINSGHTICTRFAFCSPPFSAKVGTMVNKTGMGGKQSDKTIEDTS